MDTAFALHRAPPSDSTPDPPPLTHQHSIDRAWGAMQASEGRRRAKYARVGLFRIDVAYQDKIDVSDGAAVVPRFGKKDGHTPLYERNAQAKTRVYKQYRSRIHALPWQPPTVQGRKGRR